MDKTELLTKLKKAAELQKAAKQEKAKVIVMKAKASVAKRKAKEVNE